jgi:hypothetical protein
LSWKQARWMDSWRDMFTAEVDWSQLAKADLLELRLEVKSRSEPLSLTSFSVLSTAKS